MADDYNDRMRWREESARRADGFPPDMPGEAFALYAIPELARRMGWDAGGIADMVTDLVHEEYLSGFDQIDREMAWEELATVQQESDEALLARVARCIARTRAQAAKVAA